jgi:ABC-type uncharacterized transport system fused permease/ATPase subunit
VGLVQEQSSAAAEATPNGPGRSFRDQAVIMTKAFLASPHRNKTLALGAGILAVILATAYGQIILIAGTVPSMTPWSVATSIHSFTNSASSFGSPARC